MPTRNDSRFYLSVEGHPRWGIAQDGMLKGSTAAEEHINLCCLHPTPHQKALPSPDSERLQNIFLVEELVRGFVPRAV